MRKTRRPAWFPTDENKELIEKNGLRSDCWLVIWEDKQTLEVISKRSRRRRVLEKEN